MVCHSYDISRHLIGIGGALTILCLAFDTFWQQVLTVEYRTVIAAASSANGTGIRCIARSEVLGDGQGLGNGRCHCH